MKKIILLLGIILLPVSAINGEAIKDPMAGRKFKISRPESDKILLSVSTKLRLSVKQQERIISALKKETREFDKTFDTYQIAEEKERKWRFEMNDLRHKMLKINMGISNVIRDYLDEEQREIFDKMMEKKMVPKKISPKKKKRVKRRKAKKPVKTGRVRPAKRTKVSVPKPALLEDVSAEEYGEGMGYYP